jgi:hypothetical protein
VSPTSTAGMAPKPGKEGSDLRSWPQWWSLNLTSVHCGDGDTTVG